MKKAVATWIVLAAAFCLLAVAARGQPSRPAAARGGWAMFRPGLLEAAARLDLPKATMRRVDRVLAAERESGRDSSRQMSALWRDLAEARRSGDEDTAASIRRKIADIRRSRSQGRQAAIERLGEVLTADQLEQLTSELSSPSRLARMMRTLGGLSRLGLNIKQEAMVNKVVDEAIDKIERVLTAEQRERLAEAGQRLWGGPARRSPQPADSRYADLTDQQRQDVQQIRRFYTEEITNAAPEERGRLMREMRQKIQEVIDRSKEHQGPQGQQDIEEQETESSDEQDNG